jgi:nitroimidazol reductase NimA-like FMN-containing flavoprotein (pyridoxamine 5'-phosphate oxidase superfamily)
MHQEGAESELVPIERDECLRLLASHSFGRLAVALGEGAPVIRPVNYRFDEPSQSVVIRTGEGSKFHALLRSGRDAAFEIDARDPERRSGWSVIILGVTQEITSAAEIHRLQRLGLEPYVGGDSAHWVRIRARTVSGRRIARLD